MTTPLLSQFRVELSDDGVIHLVFDCPGRTMNVFSEAAIADIGAFAAWVPDAPGCGVLIRSGKDTAFCAGADLTELGVAYDKIMAAPERTRFDLAFDHFAPLGRAFRALERAGKPVAVVIEGLALGGGCEFALAAHYRVLDDSSRAQMGLPETLVGLLPGGGGTQRLPRLCGLKVALPILLDGARLSGQAALDAGLVHKLVAPGEGVRAATAWLRSGAKTIQPWDQAEWEPWVARDVSAAIEPARSFMLHRTLGHYPAMSAVLDCLEFGLPQSFDGAYRTEMSVFAHLIQRPEARDMIQTLFLARTEYDRLLRNQVLPEWLTAAADAARAAFASIDDEEAARAVGFSVVDTPAEPLRKHTRPGYWVDEEGPLATRARAILDKIGAAVVPLGEGKSDAERRLIDYAVVSSIGYPAYLGGPIAFASR